MAAPKARNAYQLLLQAIRQQNQQQPNLDLSSPGGLLGRLLTAQAAPNQQQPSAPNSGQNLSPGDPNFRQLVRVVQPPTVVAPSIVPDGTDNVGVGADGPAPAFGSAQYATDDDYRKRMSDCVDQCLHLLSSPSGDLQSSEFRQCVGKCMGRL